MTVKAGIKAVGPGNDNYIKIIFNSNFTNS